MAALRIRKIEEITVDGLGLQIKEARKASTKSLATILKEVGLSRKYWMDVENGTVSGTLSIENLEKIENALGVSFGITI